jgi:hypothetical protein
MIRVLVSVAVLAYLAIATGCSCDCTVCCPVGESGTMMCGTSEGVSRQECEDAHGVRDCTSECK